MGTDSGEREPGWPHGPWATIAALRARPDAERIQCQAVLSGRWKSVTDRYWNSCVIEVPFRVTPHSGSSQDPTDDR